LELQDGGEWKTIGGVDFRLAEGDVWVRPAREDGEIVVSGKTHTGKDWVSVPEGDTVVVNGHPYARILGKFQPVRPAPNDAPVFAHGQNGVLVDNGDGNLTKVGGSVQRNAQLDVEQRALAILQSEGIDIAPPLVGRANANELIIGKLDGQSLDKMSIADRKAIPADAWKRLEGDLGRLAELGIHHGDISAGNIIWDGKRLRLLDFGLARIGERSADDVNRMRRIQTAVANGEEGQALFPLPNVNDLEGSTRVPEPEIPFAPRPVKN
jgi:predicted Ser/Thr protein kinase